MKNCLNCDNYISCNDPQKSVIWICKKYKVIKSELPDSIKEVLNSSIYEEVYDTYNAQDFEQEEELTQNVEYAIQSIVRENRLFAPDLKFPESDFALAPNFYTWCIDEQFGFTGIKPFVVQAIIGTRLFHEYCPKCSDNEYLLHTHKASDSLSLFENKVALLEHGVCQHCGINRLQLFKKKLLNPYSELALVCGQRSGKSQFIGAMAASYYTHRMMKVENPVQVYSLLNSTTLSMTFVALTAIQAKNLLWTPYHIALLESPWFIQYHQALKDAEYKYGEGSFYRIKDIFIQYRHRKLMATFSGPDMRTLRGQTRCWASIDELGHFPFDISSEKNVKLNAKEVFTSLQNSLLTVRTSWRDVTSRGYYNFPTGYFANASSPFSIRDQIMRRLKMSLFSRKILGIQKATWDFNPKIKKNRDLRDEFVNDPVRAERDYGANPPVATNPFISNNDVVEQCFNKTNPLKYETCYKKSKNRSISELYLKILDIVDSGKASVLALDGGVSNNSFTGAVGYRSKNGYPIISAVFEAIPEPGIRVNFSSMYQHILKDVILSRNVRVCSADRWNSLKMLSDMQEEYGIHTHQYSLKYQDIVLFRDYLQDSKLLLPKPKFSFEEILKISSDNYPYCFKGKPVEHLYLQLMTVQDAINKVTKGDSLTDDLARVVFLCFHELLSEDNDKYLNTPDKEIQTKVNLEGEMRLHLYSSGSKVSNINVNMGHIGTLKKGGN